MVSRYFGSANYPALAATLECLPRFHDILVVESPNSTSETISVLTTQKPTEDYFLFKEYKDGDGKERIHWGLSVKIGSIQVRIQEQKIQDSILLVLDNYCRLAKVLHPKYIESILTQLIGYG